MVHSLFVFFDINDFLFFCLKNRESWFPNFCQWSWERRPRTDDSRGKSPPHTRLVSKPVYFLFLSIVHKRQAIFGAKIVQLEQISLMRSASTRNPNKNKQTVCRRRDRSIYNIAREERAEERQPPHIQKYRCGERKKNCESVVMLSLTC